MQFCTLAYPCFANDNQLIKNKYVPAKEKKNN